jgi:hypothetical protein
MKKCKELIYIITDIIITWIVAIIIEIGLSIKNGNLLVAFFSGTNINIYSHIISVSCALFVENIAKMWIEEKRKKNLWTALFFKIITANFVLLTLVKIYKITHIETIIFIIVLEFLSIVIAQVIEYIIQEKITLTSKTEEVFKYLNILLTIILVVSVVIGGI